MVSQNSPAVSQLCKFLLKQLIWIAVLIINLKLRGLSKLLMLSGSSSLTLERKTQCTLFSTLQVSSVQVGE